MGAGGVGGGSLRGGRLEGWTVEVMQRAMFPLLDVF